MLARWADARTAGPQDPAIASEALRIRALLRNETDDDDFVPIFFLRPQIQ